MISLSIWAAYTRLLKELAYTLIMIIATHLTGATWAMMWLYAILFGILMARLFITVWFPTHLNNSFQCNTSTKHML